MINKYTVKFIDQEFEKKYQEYMFKEQVFPLIVAITAGIILISFIGIIEGLLLSDIPFALIRIITIIVSVIITLLVKKWPKLYKVSIFIAINYSIVYQYSLDKAVDSQYGYLMGSNLMLINLSFLVVSDFIDGSFNNILMFVSRVAITLLRSDTPYTQGHQYASFLFIVVILGLYKYNYNKRMQFYLSHKDSQWEQMLPKLIPSPFILFNYNEEQVKFQMSLSNIHGDSNDIIKEVLRNYYIGTKTLELFIHQRIKNKETLDHNRQMLLTYNKQPITIQYSEFHIVDQRFLVVLPSDQLKLLEEKMHLISKFYIDKTITLLNKVQQVLFTSVKHKNWNKVVQLFSNIGSKQNRILCQYGEQFEIQTFKLKDIISHLNLNHKGKFINNSHSQLLIKSFKPYFELVLNLIAKASIQQSVIKVYYVPPILKIVGWIDFNNLQENALFMKACSIIFTSTKISNNGYIFELNDQPNYGFTLHNLFLKQ